MECLHGKPASFSTTTKGTFWFCGQTPSSNYFCPGDDSYQFEKAIAAWRSTGESQPRFHGHDKLVRMRIVKDQMMESYSRPFFVCSERVSPCSFWMWGDQAPAVIKSTCRHGFTCCMRKVKKEGVNQGRMFFCCPNKEEDSCGYFEWAPAEDKDVFESFCTVNFGMPPS